MNFDIRRVTALVTMGICSLGMILMPTKARYNTRIIPSHNDISLEKVASFHVMPQSNTSFLSACHSMSSEHKSYGTWIIEPQVGADFSKNEELPMLTVTTHRFMDTIPTRSVDNPTPAAGTNVNYTIVVKNNGPGVAGLVTATDILPAGLTYVSSSTTQGTYNSGTGIWNIGQINPGDSVTLTLTALVSPSAGGQIITNTASAFDAYAFDPYADNNISSNTITVQKVADLQIIKVVDNDAPGAGTSVTFTIVVKNNGPGLANDISVTDTLPSGLSYISSSTSQGSYDEITGIWSVGMLTPTNTATLSLNVQISPFVSGIIQNCATTSDAYASDPYTSNNIACANINVQRIADLQVFKSLLNPSKPQTRGDH